MKSFLNIICIFLCLNLYLSSFQISLFKQMSKQFKNHNLIISPLSAYHVLGLTTNGAKGETLKEMLSALENKDLTELNKINTNILKIIKKFSTIEIANAIMTKVPPKKTFLDVASKYESSVESLKDVIQVNNWCKLKTHGKINKILNNLTPTTVMVLLNAVYFKGVWFKKFNIKKTTKKSFYNLNDKSLVKKVDTMSVTDKFKYFKNRQLQIIELPYMKDGMSAVILLPDKSKNINEFISELEDNKVSQLLKKMHQTKVNLELPKFKLEFDTNLDSALQLLGMNLPYDWDKADFSEMAPGTYIERVVHKTYLKIDEEGSVAAGATSVVMVTNSTRPLINYMKVDRPFLFMIRNNKLPQNYEMLFMAKIEKL